MKVEIETPIKRMEFDGANYKLVILDANNIYHYFNRDSSYDGWSKDCSGYGCISWCGSKVQCDLCGHIWVWVFPVECEKLECPNCHNIGMYEIVEEDDVK